MAKCKVQPFCCRKIGFNLSALAIKDCVGADGWLDQINTNIERLSQCRMMVIGYVDDFSGCNQPYGWDMGENWVRLKKWVEDGGRLVICGEYRDCMDATAFDHLNMLMGFIGSSMQMESEPGGGCNCICDHKGINQPVPIVTGLDNGGLVLACTSLISGGTPISAPEANIAPTCSRTGKYWLRAERIGDGIVFMSGDTGAFLFGCPRSDQNCQFFHRVFNWKIADML